MTDDFDFVPAEETAGSPTPLDETTAAVSQEPAAPVEPAAPQPPARPMAAAAPMSQPMAHDAALLSTEPTSSAFDAAFEAAGGSGSGASVPEGMGGFAEMTGLAAAMIERDVVHYSARQMRRAREVLTRIYAVRRTARFYPLDHPAVGEGVELLMSSLSGYFTEGVDVQLAFYEGEKLFDQRIDLRSRRISARHRAHEKRLPIAWK